MTATLPLFLLATLIVLTLGAGSAIGAFGDTHSISCLGFAAPAGSGGCHPVLIRLGDRGIASIRVVGGFLAVAGLRRCHSALILLRGSHRARIRVDGNDTLAVRRAVLKRLR